MKLVKLGSLGGARIQIMGSPNATTHPAIMKTGGGCLR